MAIKKATTTDDIKTDDSTPPTLEDRVAQVTELTDPDLVAQVDQPGYVKLKAPLGAVTTVPDSIADTLLESGYTKTK